MEIHKTKLPTETQNTSTVLISSSTCRKTYDKIFCLDNACLLFCTTSGSARLNTGRTQPLDLLVIDEAAQLKECESTIPFQPWGFRHAVLIGDERQLSAMTKSKVLDAIFFAVHFNLLIDI